MCLGKANYSSVLSPNGRKTTDGTVLERDLQLAERFEAVEGVCELPVRSCALEKPITAAFCLQMGEKKRWYRFGA